MMVLNRERVNRIMSRRNPPPFYCTLLVVIAIQVDMKTEAKTHDEPKYTTQLPCLVLTTCYHLLYWVWDRVQISNIGEWESIFIARVIFRQYHIEL